MAAISFDATTVAPQESIAPIPAGVYLAQVIESDERPLKSGNGRAVALTFEVLQGPYARRKVWASINYRHANADAERIGQSQLSALCHAVGVLRAADTTQLHMRPVMIRVKVRKDDTGQYPDRNEVGGFEAPPAGGMPPPGPGFGAGFGAGFPPASSPMAGGSFAPAQAPQQPPAANPWGAPAAPPSAPAAAHAPQQPAPVAPQATPMPPAAAGGAATPPWAARRS